MVTAQGVWMLIGCIACAALLGTSSVNAQYGAKADGRMARSRRSPRRARRCRKKDSELGRYVGRPTHGRTGACGRDA